MLVTCSYCGKEISDQASKCPFCRLPSAAVASMQEQIEVVRPYASGEWIGDKFYVKRLLGEGGFSYVYLVDSPGTRQTYALKTLRSDVLNDVSAWDLFRKEAQSWIDLGSHPYLARAFFLEEVQGRLYLAMEYVAPDERGVNSLEGYIQRQPPELAQSLRWAIQTCHGMEYAYSRGLRCHRDMKPANILIGTDGCVRISDFGIAGAVTATLPTDRQRSARADLTAVGSVFGTPTHMSPEQFEDAAVCDERSDIYGFGVVLYQLASGGRLPFALPHGVYGGHAVFAEMRRLHREMQPPALRSELFPLAAHCLRKEPSSRYKRFASLRADLETLFRRLTGETPPSPEIP